MKKIYTTPSVEITEIHSESIITVSGFKTTDKGGNLSFGDGSNVINF